MKLLMISRDKSVLEPGSAAYKRMQEYKTLFAELRVIVVRGNIFSFLSSFIRAGRIAKRMGRGDYVTAQDPFEAGIVAFVIAKVFKLKLQLQLHTDCFDPYFRRHSVLNFFRVPLAKLLLPRADSIRVVSERIKNSLTTLYPLLSTRIHILPIFVDTKVETTGKTLDLRKKYPEFQKIVLIVARLEREKNLTLALTSFQKMLRLQSGIGLVIVGRGKEESWLREYARHLGVTESVRFLGFVDNPTPLYQSADLFLVTSFYEGYGMTIIEALAQGCPVVSTDVGIAKDAGAEIADFDAGEIALKSLEVLRNGQRAELAPGFVISKAEYLERYKQTFKI